MMRWRMLRVLVVIVMLDCVWSWQGRTVTFHRLDLDDLVGFVSDSTAAVSSDGCPALVEVAYEGRDEVRIDPSAMSLVPSCEKLGTRRMLSYGKLCEDVKNYGGEGCEERGCEVWKEELERDMPFNVSVMEGATLYVYRETNFTGGRSLSAFLMEDTPVGGCEEYLESVQSGTEPRHRDDIGRRTFLSGDVLIVKVEKNGTAEKECLFVAEDRHQDARYMVSHRVRVADEETADVEGSEAKFQQTWAAKVGLWKDMIVAEFTEDVRSRRKYLELRVKRVSKAKALLLAKQITRADLLGVVVKVRPSFAQSFSPDGHLWYRVDGGGVLSVFTGGWKQVGAFDPSAILLGVFVAATVVTLSVYFIRKKRRAARGYTVTASNEDDTSGSMLSSPDYEEQ